MKKRILTLLLAGIMVFGTVTEGVSAADMKRIESTDKTTAEEGQTTENIMNSTETGGTNEAAPDTEANNSESGSAAVPKTNNTSGEAETEIETEASTEMPTYVPDMGSGTENAVNVQIPETEASTEEIFEESTQTDTEEPQSDAMHRGLFRPEIIDLDWSDTDDVYEGDIDSTGASAYNSQWDSYSSNYYYNMLNEDQKEFWDQLDSMCLGYLTGNTSLTTNARDSSGKILPVCITQSVNYKNMSMDQAYALMLMFRCSKPQYYFLAPYLSMVRGDVGDTFGRGILTVYDTFCNGGARAAETAKFKSVVDSWVAEINAQPSDLLKEKKAHDMICQKVIYDMNYGKSTENKFNQVAYSVFLTDSTVCAGYSQAMQLLCNAVGIDCGVVTSLDHEWNIVRLNNTWYYVDCTWDDIDRKQELDGKPCDQVYLYFNRSKDFYLSNQGDLSSGAAVSHVTESFWNPYLPALNHDTGSDYRNVGELYVPQSKMAAPVISVSNNKVNISSPSGGTVYYTTDGTAPSVAATRSTRYTVPFEVPSTGSVKAIAVNDGVWDSDIVDKQSVICTVTFDSRGGKAVAPKIVESGSLVEKPSNPSRTGYTFSGWCTDTSGKSAYNFGSPVTANLTLYAKWSPKKYTVTLNANGGYISKKSTKTKKVSVTYDKKYGSLTSAKRSNYVFNGWYTKKSGGTKITSSSKVLITGKKTYYAHWSKVKPKKAAISSVKSTASGKMTVKIKNISSASGYQIRYSLKSNMSSAKSNKTGENSKNISGLKKGKKYYVQVRMYQKESVSGKTYYGSWSSKKSIKIKK